MNKEEIKAQFPQAYEAIFQLGVNSYKAQVEQSGSVGFAEKCKGLGITPGMIQIMSSHSNITSDSNVTRLLEFDALVSEHLKTA